MIQPKSDKKMVFTENDHEEDKPSRDLEFSL